MCLALIETASFFDFSSKKIQWKAGNSFKKKPELKFLQKSTLVELV